jgi:hypothetical protein
MPDALSATLAFNSQTVKLASLSFIFALGFLVCSWRTPLLRLKTNGGSSPLDYKEKKVYFSGKCPHSRGPSRQREDSDLVHSQFHYLSRRTP